MFFLGIDLKQALQKKEYKVIEETLGAAIALRNTQDANFALNAMLRDPNIINVLQLHPEIHNRLLTYAIKLSYPDVVGLLLGENYADVELCHKEKNMLKVLIQTLANTPDLFDENYQLLQIVCANEKFRQMIGTQANALIKQINRDLNDKKTLKAIKQEQNLGEVDTQRMRAVQAVILELQKYEDASVIIDTNKYAGVETHDDAVQFIEQQKNAAALKKTELKLVKTVDQFSSLNLGEYRTPEMNSYITTFINAIKNDNVELVSKLVDRQDSNFGQLKPVELNQLLRVALVFRANKVLRKMLSTPQLQACVAGQAFRNRLFCFAIATVNPAAATAFLEITAVGTRMEQTSKDVLKNLIRATAYMPQVLTKDLIAAICSDPRFKKILTEEYQTKQASQGIYAILKEIAKDLRGDLDDDETKPKIKASATTNPNAHIAAIEEIIAFLNEHERGTTLTSEISRQADKVASIEAHKQKKLNYNDAAKKLATLLNKK